MKNSPWDAPKTVQLNYLRRIIIPDRFLPFLSYYDSDEYGLEITH